MSESLVNKVVTLRPATISIRRSGHRCSVNFAQYLSRPILYIEHPPTTASMF